MKKIIFIISFLSFVNINNATEISGRFITGSDISNIKAAAKTDWGKKVVANLKENVEERAKYGFTIPTKITGRKQNYICPEHKKLLKFQLDKPNEHWCEDCKKYYKSDFLDACWMNMYQHSVSKFLVDCGYLFIATEDVRYFNYIKEVFLKYADVYPGYPTFTKEQVDKDYYLGRMFEQWLEEAMWFSDVCPVYEIVRDRLTSDEQKKIETNLFGEAAQLIKARKGEHNWQSWNNAMRASLAVTLNDKEMMEMAINGKIGYIAEFKRMVYDDGWFKEVSPGYHYFPLKALMQTANAARAMGINLYDEKLKLMFTGVVKALYSNMTFPAHNDGGYMYNLLNQAFLYEMAFSRYNDSSILDILSRIYAHSERNSAQSLLNFVDIKPKSSPLKQASHLFDKSGIAVIRSNNNTLVFRYGFSDGGHSHRDRLSVTLHDGDHEILTDCGTYSYAQPAYLGWQKRGLAHNLVLVDGKEMKIKPAVTAGKLLSYESDKKGGKATAMLDNGYDIKVTLQRTVSLYRSTFTDYFTATSDSVRTYDYVFSISAKPELDNGFTDAVFQGNSPAYEFIKEVKSRKYPDGKIKFKAGKNVFEIENTLNEPFEIFLAQSPDIMIQKESGTMTIPTYMIVVRTRGKNLSLQSKIKI